MKTLTPTKVRIISVLAAILFTTYPMSGRSATKAKVEAQEPEQAVQAAPVTPVASVNFPTILYGAAYYHEYEPYERLIRTSS